MGTGILPMGKIQTHCTNDYTTFCFPTVWGLSDCHVRQKGD